MHLLQSNRIDLGFIGGAEVDRFGNLNTHWVEENSKTIRLPGSGGAADIAAMAKRCIIIITTNGAVSHLKFITSPLPDMATAVIGALATVSSAEDRAGSLPAWAYFRSIP